MKGIAKVLEQRLHEFGIYTYEQIASWTEDQIKEFSSRLAFKDRIHREKWVEQARKLLDEQKNQAA
jgi:predicted flap endonuclease-1-like 5' DNA nuclease